MDVKVLTRNSALSRATEGKGQGHRRHRKLSIQVLEAACLISERLAPIQPLEGNPSGTANSEHHEGVRNGRREPPNDLQLDRGEQGGISAHCRRQHPDFCGYAVAGAGWHQASDESLRSLAGIRIVGVMTTSSKELLHKLNNQLGVILAHAELIEAKAQDAAQKARASQVVNAALQAMAVSRELRETVGNE